ncbi:hypothetical protein [Chitinibacter tainanensis]|uniref:hypothetical protein n=1 Tax=Chitinibacter tainanensis TaxID=230667 RepID=UPI002356D7E1|nr:hypothetical protein [Chitinibacter tainanensis]
MRITIMSEQKKKPAIGDVRTTKKHGYQIRVVVTSRGMWCKSGSRYLYEWRSPESLVGTQWEYLTKKCEHQLAAKQAGKGGEQC